MPRADLVRSVEIARTPRVLQVESLFEVPVAERSEERWRVDLPIEDESWNIGLIVGPSGSGKSSVARELFGPHLVESLSWPADRSVVDAFPETMPVKEIAGLLSSVGFSSPPSWLRPFRALSNGEQFRVHLARALAESRDLVVIDEFTSVVDRTVARIGSAAVARTVRDRGQRFVAVTCHYDIEEWLQPDWVYEPATNLFRRRSLQRRPSIDLRISHVDPETWRLFAHHHYLSRDLNTASRCYCAFWDGQPVAFVAVLAFPHHTRPGWRAHRIVCLPDYQGVGIGNRVSEQIAAAYLATGKPYWVTTSHPALIGHLSRSSRWFMKNQPRLNHVGKGQRTQKTASYYRSVATNRLTATFEYVGPPDLSAARILGIV